MPTVKGNLTVGKSAAKSMAFTERSQRNFWPSSCKDLAPGKIGKTLSRRLSDNG